MTRKKGSQPSESNPDRSDLVPVMFAANRNEAEFYQTLLADADIQAVIDSEAEDSNGKPAKGIAVLVPAELLDDASDIITAREEIEEHILAGPDEPALDDDEDDELGQPGLDDDVEDEDLFFHRDPFGQDDD